MEPANGIFAAKLQELEQQYGQMQSKLLLYQQTDHETIRSEIQRMMEVCCEDILKLHASVEFCRSPAVSALASVQKEYLERTKEILDYHIMDYMRTEYGDSLETRTEATTLYAEYAIDFAKQAVNHALLSALSAIDLQMMQEEAEQG